MHLDKQTTMGGQKNHLDCFYPLKVFFFDSIAVLDASSLCGFILFLLLSSLSMRSRCKMRDLLSRKTVSSTTFTCGWKLFRFMHRLARRLRAIVVKKLKPRRNPLYLLIFGTNRRKLNNERLARKRRPSSIFSSQGIKNFFTELIVKEEKNVGKCVRLESKRARK